MVLCGESNHETGTLRRPHTSPIPGTGRGSPGLREGAVLIERPGLGSCSPCPGWLSSPAQGSFLSTLPAPRQGVRKSWRPDWKPLRRGGRKRGKAEPWQSPSVHLYIVRDWVGVGHRHRRVGLQGRVTQDSQGPSPNGRSKSLGPRHAGLALLPFPGPAPSWQGEWVAQQAWPSSQFPLYQPHHKFPSWGVGGKTFQTLAEPRGRGSSLLRPCPLETGFIKCWRNWE